MREFDKWWNDSAHEMGIKFNKHQTYLAWKAALEWAYIQRLCSDEGWYIPPHVIKEELNK